MVKKNLENGYKLIKVAWTFSCKTTLSSAFSITFDSLKQCCMWVTSTYDRMYLVYKYTIRNSCSQESALSPRPKICFVAKFQKKEALWVCSSSMSLIPFKLKVVFFRGVLRRWNMYGHEYLSLLWGVWYVYGHFSFLGW